MLVISSATLASKPRLVFKPWMHEVSMVEFCSWCWGAHCSHSSSTLSQQAQPGKGIFNAGDAVRQLLHISTKLLTEGQRSGILQVRAADLDDLVESLRLRVEGISQRSQGRDEILADLENGSNVHDGGESVVRALAHVNVVVGVDWFLGAKFTAQDLDRPVRNDLPNS